MCDVPIYKVNPSNFELRILDYFKELHDWGWYISKLYKGDYKITYQLTRTVIEMEPYAINKCQYEVTFDSKKLKNGKNLYIFNDDLYSTEDEVIEEMKKMGIR